MLTIVWDVDDVLNNLMQQWYVNGWLQEHPNCALHYSDLTSNPPHRVLDVNLEEYLASMDAFRRTQAGIELSPNNEILQWFVEYGHQFRHIALTARPLDSAPDVAAWVMRYFGTWVRCFGVVPTRTGQAIPIYDSSKGEFLSWLGKGDVMVDDTPENLTKAEQLGLQVFAWPQPWTNLQNNSKIKPKLGTTEILQELTKMAAHDD